MSHKPPFEIVCCIKSWDATVYNHLMPIALHPKVTKLWIVRPEKSAFGEIPNSEYILTPSSIKPLIWLKMYRACNMLAKKEAVKAVVSFNPIPYGLLAYRASKKNHKPIHLGFIGSDWNTYSQKLGKQFLMRCYNHADFITCTGKKMKTEMIQKGLTTPPIEILPHGVDQNKFSVDDNGDKKYSCIFIGQLNALKRVNDILAAFAKVSIAHPTAKLCIVGDGPLKSNLIQQAQSLNIAHLVDFLGFQKEVLPYLQQSKMIIIASETEGFPFSIVEGASCGLIPITTPVGTICDHIKDNVNGLIFPTYDIDALANNISNVLSDNQLSNRLFEGLKTRISDFGYDKATAVWDKWFETL